MEISYRTRIRDIIKKHWYDIQSKEMLKWEVPLTLYHSFVYPYLTYCNQVWGSTYTSNLEKLFALQKKALEIMCSMPKWASTDPLFHELGILKFHDINLYLTSKFVFRFYKSEVPELFISFYPRPVWPSGIVFACVCLSVRVSITCLSAR